MRDSTQGIGLFDLPGSSRFEPARLTQARTRVGLKKSELAASVGVSAAAVGQYEAGVNTPRAEVLDALARSLDVRPGFFSAGRPLARIDAVDAHFRSLRSARVGDRQKALSVTTLIWELTFALERYVRLPDANLPTVPEGASPAEAAALLREHWDLPDGPVKHLVATIESRGVVVVVRPPGEIDTVDAFSATIVDRPIVVTTPRRSANVFRHRFSIAHELGHLLMHGDAGEPTAAIEKEADEFAASFLTPASSIDALLPDRLDLVALDRLGRTWGVSSHSLVRRMVERGRTTESSARRAYQRLSTLTDPNADPSVAYPGETPKLLARAAELAAQHGLPTAGLSDVLQVPPRLVRDLLGSPDQRPVLRLVE